jgi:hypothetical protein
MTAMSVATPIVSPSAVSEARSLCPRRALKHWARLSLKASMVVLKISPITLSNPEVQEYLSEEAGTSKRIRRKSDRGIALPDDRTDQLPDGRYSEMIVGPVQQTALI